MEPPIDPEEMVACPYDPVHMFKSKRLIYHLEKCRKVSLIGISANYSQLRTFLYNLVPINSIKSR